MKNLEDMTLNEIEKYKDNASKELTYFISELFKKYPLLDEFLFISKDDSFHINRDKVPSIYAKINKTINI